MKKSLKEQAALSETRIRGDDDEVCDASFQILIHVLVQSDDIAVRQQLKQRVSDTHERHL